ncbi:MAG TPA: hypothetical protein DCE56_43865, partial [Cyanobacteria bacterium UBA8553]|nr:hypothetical protein [Cyanobacteria bacterium UBA8553]
MANPGNIQPSFNSPKAATTPMKPLGIKNPLLPSSPLGQKFLSPKFLSPLGAKPLTTSNSLASSRQEMLDYNLSESSFGNSPELGDFPFETSLPTQSNREASAVESFSVTSESVSDNSPVENPTTVQAFSETELPQLRAQIEPEVTEAEMRSQPTEQPSQANSAPSPLAPELSSLAATTSFQESIGQSFTENSPAQSEKTETASTEKPTVQTFSAPTPSAPSPIDLAQTISSPSSGTPSATADTTPTQPPVAQAFSENSTPSATAQT